MNINLFLAFFWMVAGCGIMIWDSQKPGGPTFVIRGTTISIGWLGVIMGLYNVVRWWAVRSNQALRRAREEEEARRHLAAQRRPTVEPDPNFQFTDRPPRPEESRGDQG